MLILHIALGLFSVGLMVLDAGVASSQSYPNKPIRILTTSAGSATDMVARLIAQGITGSLGQPVIVENRGGAVPGTTVAGASHDGYTLLASGTSLWTSALTQNVPYDPARDFAPISMVGRSPSILVVTPSLPVQSVKDLIALAKARPGELNYSAGAAGGTSHLAGEAFNSMAGVKIVAVRYSSGSQETIDLISGRVHLTFGNVGAVMPHVKTGKLRALAVTSAQPSELFPQLPTIAASGVPGYEKASIQGMFAPAKTPAPIIKRLNQEIVRFVNTPEAKETLLNSGIETATSSPEQFAAAIKSEMVRLSKLIKDAGIKFN